MLPPGKQSLELIDLVDKIGKLHCNHPGHTFSISSMNLSPVRTSTVSEKLLNFFLRSSALSFEGMSETVIFSSTVRRKLICVAKRVQRVLATGNWIPVRASRSEDFPLDWSPTTTNYGIMSNANYFWAEPICNLKSKRIQKKSRRKQTCGREISSLTPNSRSLSIISRSLTSSSLSNLSAVTGSFDISVSLGGTGSECEGGRVEEGEEWGGRGEKGGRGERGG